MSRLASIGVLKSVSGCLIAAPGLLAVSRCGRFPSRSSSTGCAPSHRAGASSLPGAPLSYSSETPSLCHELPSGPARHREPPAVHGEKPAMQRRLRFVAGTISCLQQGGKAWPSHVVHTHKIAGSNPAPATSLPSLKSLPCSCGPP